MGSAGNRASRRGKRTGSREVGGVPPASEQCCRYDLLVDPFLAVAGRLLFRVGNFKHQFSWFFTREESRQQVGGLLEPVGHVLLDMQPAFEHPLS
jgi:hypothetical protein